MRSYHPADFDNCYQCGKEDYLNRRFYCPACERNAQDAKAEQQFEDARDQRSERDSKE